MEEEVAWYFSRNHQLIFLWRALQIMTLIPTSIKILRPLGVLRGFMVNQKLQSIVKPGMISGFLSIIQIPYGFVQGILMKLLSKEKSWVELCKVIIRSNILGK